MKGDFPSSEQCRFALSVFQWSLVRAIKLKRGRKVIKQRGWTGDEHLLLDARVSINEEAISTNLEFGILAPSTKTYAFHTRKMTASAVLL